MESFDLSNHSSSMTSIRDVLGDVLKEVSRRAELRPRLEAELGRTLSDDEFIELAEQSGPTI